MMEPILKIDFSELTEAIPAFITMIAMPFTTLLLTGSFLVFSATSSWKLFTGKMREIHPVLAVLALVFVIYLVY